VPQLHLTDNSIFIIHAAVPSPQIQSVQVTLTPYRASSLTKLFPASVGKIHGGQDNNRNHITVRSRFNPTIFTT
jgi:hypothetical protein